MSFSSSYSYLHPSTSVVTECERSWFSLLQDRFSSLVVIPLALRCTYFQRRLRFFFLILPLKTAAQNCMQHFTRDLSHQHLARQYDSNASPSPGKVCTGTASNSNFLWLTTAPRLSPPLNPSASVHCQNVYYFSLSAARSYLLQYYISHCFCYCDYFILLVKI